MNFFEKLFEKTILISAAKNAIKLLDMSISTKRKENQFLQNYASDKMAPTFEVLRYQREYLYQTFHELGSRLANPLGGDKKKFYLHRKTTKEQTANPYMVSQMLNKKARAQEMKEKLQTKTSDAVEKMSEYALKNPNFNYGFCKTECDFKIKELATKEKAEAFSLRRAAQIKALEQGLDISKMNFYDKNVLRSFIAYESTDSLITDRSNESRKRETQKSFDLEDFPKLIDIQGN